jgi:hypothetical protein
MFDSNIFGFGDFHAAKEIVKLANQLRYKESDTWSLPKWELLKKMYPFDSELNFPNKDLLWTDNATNASYTAKKLDLSNGQFINCSTREEYEQPAYFRLYNTGEYQNTEVDHYDSGSFGFVILPFGKMTFEEVDRLNNALSAVSYKGFQHFIRPDIEQLAMVYPIISHLFTDKDSWFWSSTVGGKYKAHWFNMMTGEIYACKKTADYSVNQAFSLAIVQWSEN